MYHMGFQGGTVVKNTPANARDAGEAVLTPGSGRTLEEEMATLSSILPWEISWTEEPVSYSPLHHKEPNMTKQLNMNR